MMFDFLLKYMANVIFFGVEQFNCNFVRDSCSNASFRNVCFEHLGCFYNGPPYFDPIYRIISNPPEAHVYVGFKLFTPENKDQAYMLGLNNRTVQASPFDERLDTKFVIHGFLSKTTNDSFLFIMKDELLKVGNFNVIVVDWASSNHFPYAQAVANSRMVGAQIAYLLTIIQEYKGIDYRNVHMIGHSLGAHICGFASKRLIELGKPKIGRISGLDPAGVDYEESDKVIRLDKSDALFVDIIHTNGAGGPTDGFGLIKSIGHQDFYPNGGERQPACDIERAYLDEVLDMTLSGCDHQMSHEYFIQSIRNCPTFYAIKCDTYGNFGKGKCPRNQSTVAVMGYHAKPRDNIKGKATFYLNTQAYPPYCISNNSVDI